jgi:septum formation protein
MLLKTQSPSIYLASRSPRRAELLQQMGVLFTVVPADIDETPHAMERSDAYVKRLAIEKAQAGYALVLQKAWFEMPVLAADTSVSFDGEILGKPQNDEDAYRMLSLMSGRWHEVHTGIAVAQAGHVAMEISSTMVQMDDLSDAVIRAYIATGEPKDKAGAYGIQGIAGSLIKRIEGSYSGVMGLPVYETAKLLKQAGIALLGA